MAERMSINKVMTMKQRWRDGESKQEKRRETACLNRCWQIFSVQAAHSRSPRESDWLSFGLFPTPICLPIAYWTRICHVTHFQPHGCSTVGQKCLKGRRIEATVANWSLGLLRAFQCLHSVCHAQLSSALGLHEMSQFLTNKIPGVWLVVF